MSDLIELTIQVIVGVFILGVVACGVVGAFLAPFIFAIWVLAQIF